MQKDDLRVHPDAAANDEVKAELRKDLDTFDTLIQAPPGKDFNEEKARERLALILAQIYAKRWDISPEQYDYNLADEFIGILRIGQS